MTVRAFRRWQVSWSIKIKDHITDKWFGNVRDISLGGMGMISKFPLQPKTIHTLKIDLSEEDTTFDELTLEAKIIWCKEQGKDMYRAGMLFKDRDDMDKEKIQEIIDKYGFPA